VQSHLLEFRSYLVSLPSIVPKLFFNTYILTGLQYLQNILAYFSVQFFFLTGSPHGNHGIGNVGEMYLVEAFFLVVGIIALLRDHERKFTPLFIWGVLVICIAAMTREAPQATRGFFLIVPLVIFSAQGCIASFSYLLSLKIIELRYIGLSCIVLLFAFNVFYYFISYYNRFPIAYAPQWRSEDYKLVAYIKDNETKYSQILIDTKADFLYTSLLYYLAYSPRDFQRTDVRLPDDSEGFSKVRSFGKFTFKDIDWVKDTKTPNTLIIASPKQERADLPIVIQFFYPQKPVVVAVGQNIMQFPVQDKAYVVLETK
jgi:hypothetical protein